MRRAECNQKHNTAIAICMPITSVEAYVEKIMLMMLSWVSQQTFQVHGQWFQLYEIFSASFVVVCPQSWNAFKLKLRTCPLTVNWDQIELWLRWTNCIFHTCSCSQLIFNLQAMKSSHVQRQKSSSSNSSRGKKKFYEVYLKQICLEGREREKENERKQRNNNEKALWVIVFFVSRISVPKIVTRSLC